MRQLKEYSVLHRVFGTGTMRCMLALIILPAAVQTLVVSGIPGMKA